MNKLKLFLVLLAMLAGPAQSAEPIEPSDLYGVWEFEVDGETATVEIRPDGTATAETPHEVMDLTWRLDLNAEPFQMTFTVDGEDQVSLIRLDDPGVITMTTGVGPVPDRFEGELTVTLRRISELAPAEPTVDVPGFDPTDLHGTWETDLQGDRITVTFRPDGSGVVFEGDRRPDQFTWQLDTDASPALLTIQNDDDRLVSLIRLDEAGVITITEPSQTAAPDFEARDTLTFRRTALIDGTQVEIESPVLTHPTIYDRLGLDLSTPEGAAETFLTALQTYDGLTVYFTLAPDAREAVWRTMMTMQLNDLLGYPVTGDPFDGDFREVFDAMAIHMAEESTDPENGIMIVEPWPLLIGSIAYGADTGRPPIGFIDNPQIQPAAVSQHGVQTVAAVEVTGDGPRTAIHLVESIHGRWRVLGVTQERDGEGHTWLLREPRRR